MKRWLIALLIPAAAAVAIGATLAAVAPAARLRGASYTDAAQIRIPARGAPLRQILWQPATPVPAPINTTADEYEPRLSTDGLTLVFVRGRPGANADLYTSKWTPDGWTDPAPITALNTPKDELGPELSHDGKSLYFYSDRPGGLGGYDIWVSRAADSGWAEPLNLGPQINTEFNEYGPALAPPTASAPADSLLYFSSNRPRPGEPIRQRDAWPATIRESRDRHDYDLYTSVITEAGPQATAPIAELNTPDDEGAPAVSPIGDFLYFASDRAGGSGGFDIYRARRLRGSHTTAESLGPSVNSTLNDLDPALSTDGFRLYFSSNRPAPADPLTASPTPESPTSTSLTPTDSAAQSDTADPSTPVGPPSLAPAPPTTSAPSDYSLWITGSREVFLEADPNAARLAWADFWRTVGPWLLFLLIAALLTLALFMLMRHSRWRDRYGKLGLMARCLIVSVFIHLILASLLTVWQVGGRLGEFIKGSSGGGGRVILASAGAADGIARQLGGSDLALAPTTPALLVSQAASIPTIEISAETVPLDVASTPAPIDTSQLNLPVAAGAEPPTSTPSTLQPAPVAPSAAPDLSVPAEESRPAPTAEPRSTLAASTPTSTPQAAPAVPTLAAPARADLAPPTTPQANLDRAPLEPSRLQPSSTPTPASTPTDIPAAPAIASAPSAVPLNTPSIAAPTADTATTEPSSSIPSQSLSASSTAPAAPAVSLSTDAPRIAINPAASSIASPSSPDSAGGLAVQPSSSPSPSTTSAPAPISSGPMIASTTSSVPVATPSLAAPATDSSTSDEPSSSIPSASFRSAASTPAAPSLGLTTDTPRTTLNPTATPSASRDTAGGLALQPSAASTSSAPSASSSPLFSSTPAQFPPAQVGSLALSTPTDSGSPDNKQAATAEPSSGQHAPGQGLVQRIDSPRAAIASGPNTADAPQSIHLNPGRGTPSASSDSSRLDVPLSSTPGRSSSTPSTGPLPIAAAGPAPDSAAALGLRLPAVEPEPLASANPGTGTAAGSSPNPSAEPVGPPVPTETFSQRSPDARAEILDRMGGSAETEQAVTRALDWLAKHQSRDGRWSGQDFDDNCGYCRGDAEIDSDAAITSMALLCYLGAGHTHQSDGPYRDNVRRALTWLVSRQDNSGDLRQGETMYAQALASVALCEAFSMTRDPMLDRPTRRAVAFLVQGPRRDPRNPRDAAARASDDTSVLGWQVMAMQSARRAGIAVPDTTFTSARRFLDQVIIPGSAGRYAYTPNGRANAAMTAEAMFVQQLLGHTRDEERMRDSARFILDTPPRWNAGAPTYYWYYATLALFQQQGESWRAWNEALTPELLNNQRRDGKAAGSWDPQDEWSRLGGRIYQTAICTLSLEVYYRYRAEPSSKPTPAPSSSAR